MSSHRCGNGCTVITGVAAPPDSPAADGGSYDVIPFFTSIAQGVGEPGDTFFSLTATGVGGNTPSFPDTAMPMPEAGVVTRVRYNVTANGFEAPVRFGLWRAAPPAAAPTNTGAFDLAVPAFTAPVAATVDGEYAFAQGERIAIGVTVPPTSAMPPVPPEIRAQGSILIRFTPPA